MQTIIDRPAIHHFLSLGVNNENLRRAIDTQGFGDKLRFVDEYGEVVTKISRFGDDSGAIILGLWVEHKKLHPLIGILIANCAQLGHAVANNRAAVALHENDNRLLIAIPAQFVVFAGLVKQRKVTNALRLASVG